MHHGACCSLISKVLKLSILGVISHIYDLNSNFLREFTDLRPKALIYTGVADLPQFSVTKVAAKNLNKTAVFVMTLKRKIAYHIISVYLPSATIFFISLVTMYVHIKHVEATIMVHLTAMLVMYTLFQAISISLPKVTQKYQKS